MSAARARMTGVVYLSYFLTAILAQFLTNRGLVAYGDAVNLVAFGCYAAMSVLFYHLFEPVSAKLSFLAASFSIVGCLVGALSLFNLAPANVSPLLFFGPYCLLIGYLILRATFLPRILGALMALAGFGWLLFLSPLVAKAFTTPIEVVGIVAEASLMLWLLVMGVHVSRWKNQHQGVGWVA
jgi:hypothetical protein